MTVNKTHWIEHKLHGTAWLIEEPIEDHGPHVPLHSCRLYCPECGVVWGEQKQSINGHTNRWYYWAERCNIHNGGKLLPDHLIPLAPASLLKYEILRETP